jgi:hypothetical protein
MILPLNMDSITPLKFIENNWVILALTWNDHGNNLIETLSPEILHFLEKQLIPKGTLWSCFDCAGLMLDIYGAYTRKSSNMKKIINDINFIENEFVSGYIYQFGIMNHEFIVIYDSSGIIYYIDYYMETGRGCRQLNSKEILPQAFRFEIISKEELFKYLVSYLNEDFIYHASFHKGDSLYYENYVNDYKYAQTLDDNTCNFYKLDFAKYKISKCPTISSIIDTVNKSVTEDDIKCGNFETVEERETWVNIRNFLLNSLKQ